MWVAILPGQRRNAPMETQTGGSSVVGELIGGLKKGVMCED